MTSRTKSKNHLPLQPNSNATMFEQRRHTETADSLSKQHIEQFNLRTEEAISNNNDRIYDNKHTNFFFQTFDVEK